MASPPPAPVPAAAAAAAPSSGAVSHSPSGAKSYYTTGNAFEGRFGYHRAVRKGPFIAVAGTTALDAATGALHGRGDAGAQATRAFEEALAAVAALGGRVADVLRVRMFVARPDDAAPVGAAFAARFRAPDGGPPAETGVAATMIVVGAGGFVDREMLVEIELDAVVS